MAEQAEEVGWLNRTGWLLEESLKGPFSLAEHKDQVALLVAMRKLMGKDPKGEAMLNMILESDDVDEQTLVHAIWIKAHLLNDHGETKLAVQWIQKGLEILDEGDSLQTKNRLRAFLAEVKAQALNDGHIL